MAENLAWYREERDRVVHETLDIISLYLASVTRVPIRIFTGSMRTIKSPLKIWENRERGRIHGLPDFLKYPLLSQEWVKLRKSNLADIFRGSVRTKAN